MSQTLTLLIIGLAVGGVGALIFYGGTRIIDRQEKALGGFAGCLVSLLGAVVIFAGFGLIVAAFFAQ